MNSRNRKSSLGCAIVVAFLGMLPHRSAEPQQREWGEVPAQALSLAEAVAIAKRHNPTFLAHRNDAGVAKWSVRSAYADLVPTLNASNSFGYIAPGERRSGSVVLAQQPAIISSSYSIGLTYTLTAQRLGQPSVAGAELAVTHGRIAGATALLVSDVTRNYLTALQAQQAIAQTEREVARTRDYLQLARARTDAGATSPIELKRAEIQHAQAELRRLRAENQSGLDMLALGRSMGIILPPDTRLTTQFELIEPTWDADSLVAVAIRRGAAVALSRASEQAARARLRMAQRGYLPSLTFSVNHNGWVQSVGSIDAGVRQRLGDNPDPAAAERVRAELLQQRQGFPFNYNKQPVGASVSMSLPLVQGLGRVVQIQSSRAALEDAEFQRRAEELRVRLEVTAAAMNLRSAHHVATLQRVIREKAAEELRLAHDRVRYGGVSPLALTEAQTQLAQAEMEEIQAVYDFHRQIAALEMLIGGLLR